MKRLFPISSMSTNMAGFIVSLAIYIVLGALVGWVCSALAGVWLINIFASWIGTIIGIYLFAGVIVSIVTFVNNKDK